MFKNIYEILKIQQEKNPETIAITDTNYASLSYQCLLEEITKLHEQLISFGVSPQDKVAITLPNGLKSVVVFLSVAITAICAPLNPNYTTSEFEFYLSDIKAKALIIEAETSKEAVKAARKLNIPIITLSSVIKAKRVVFTLVNQKNTTVIREIESPKPDDIALVLHTSGTTSRPKIVPLTHKNLCTSAVNIATSLNLQASDRALNMMPLFHIHGLVGVLLSSFTVGASIVCTSGFNAPKFFDWLEEFTPTWYSAVPTMHQSILARVKAHKDIIVCSSLRFIRSSSASLPPKVMKTLEQEFNVPVIEAFGMTEASHQVTTNLLPPHQRKMGSVGRAVGSEVAIMAQEYDQILSSGEIGEVVIKGNSVTLGYENNPQANKKAFNQGWFRTGDLGYLDDEGYLFLKGRIKEIINRAGEKISPREVEEVLLDHSAIKQVVTFAVPHKLLGEDVAAAIVLKDNAIVSEQELKNFAAQRLAQFKVPRIFVFLSEIPKGATGKIQRIGLAQKLGLNVVKPNLARPKYVAPGTNIEEELVKIWSEVLRKEQIGIHDNFFELGGDSVLAAQIINRIRDSMQIELSFLTFFEQITVASMATKIIQTQTEKLERKEILKVRIKKKKEQNLAPLSSSQAIMWLLYELAPSNPAYNVPSNIQLIGTLNVAALEKSLNEIVKRHEVLRTSFCKLDGQTVQKSVSSLILTLPILDLSNLSSEEKKNKTQQLIAEEVQLPFDLSTLPLVRTTLLKLEEEEHILLLTMHHIIFDGWSRGILLRELATIYKAFCNGQTSLLSELPIQYADFACWQQQRFQREEDIASGLDYWRKQLEGDLPVLEWSSCITRTAVQTNRSARQYLILSKDLSEALKKLSKQEEVTLFMTLLGAFKSLLYLYTGNEDIMIGSLIANRNQVEIEGLIGFFANTLVLRTQLGGNLNFRELLSRVRQITLQAYAHQNIPFERLMVELQQERDMSYNPLFQVLLVLHNTQPPMTDLKFSGLTFSPLKGYSRTAKLDLSLSLTETEQGLFGAFEYNTDLFHKATITRMMSNWQTLLEQVVADPDKRICDLSMFNQPYLP
ncbi:MAG: condensation domain-containing protein [Xenococcaceae cyanobacterium]